MFTIKLYSAKIDEFDELMQTVTDSPKGFDDPALNGEWQRVTTDLPLTPDSRDTISATIDRLVADGMYIGGSVEGATTDRRELESVCENVQRKLGLGISALFHPKIKGEEQSQVLKAKLSSTRARGWASDPLSGLDDKPWI